MSPVEPRQPSSGKSSAALTAKRPRPAAPPKPAAEKKLLPLIREATEKRRSLISRANTNSYRLVNSAGDGLYGLIVDRYGDNLVMHMHASKWKEEECIEALREAYPEMEAIFVRRHAKDSSQFARPDISEIAPVDPLWGKPSPQFDATELGVNYRIRMDEGLSVGLFIDMREVRSWLKRNSEGKRVLNLFAYTCSLGVAATLGSAQRVVNLDLSKPYLEWGKENYALNDLPVDDKDFIFGDAFDWLGRFAKRGEQFDIVILDPPSFSTAREGRFSVERDYAALVAAASAVIPTGGTLLAATNHAGVALPRFQRWVQTGVADTQRVDKVIRRWHEPDVDFPIAEGDFPYLKAVASELVTPPPPPKKKRRWIPPPNPNARRKKPQPR